LEQFQEGEVVGNVEEILGVEAGKCFFVYHLADLEEGQVATEIDSKQCFRLGTKPVLVHVPLVG
jgi:hypothetical protein